MKKRKRDEGGSLDSLLDTMTTVVGILIILLIVVQLGAESAVERIVDEKKEEDTQALEEMAMTQFDAQRKALLAEKERILQRVAAADKNAQQVLKEISALEKRLAEARKDSPDVAKLRKEHAARKKQVASLSKDAEKKEGEQRKLRALLAETPKPNVAALSKDVNLPDPKPAPPGAKPFRFLCREGRIYPMDDLALRKKAEAAVAQSGVKPNNLKEYDGKKLVASFAKKKPGDAFFILRPIPGGDKLIRFTMDRRPNAGVEEASLAKPASPYLKALAKIDPRKHYLQFEVFPDSFAAYLAARAISSTRGFPAGWKPAHRSGDWWNYYWGHKDIGRSKVPPPKPPKPGDPKPKPKPKPKLPATVID